MRPIDESALKTRLDAIEPGQSVVLSLLVAGSLLAGAWYLVETVGAVTAWTAGAATVALVASTVGVYRRRQARA